MCFPGLPQSRHGSCPGEAFRALADMFLPLEGAQPASLSSPWLGCEGTGSRDIGHSLSSLANGPEELLA